MNITQLARDKLSNYDDPDCYASKLRKKRFSHFMGLIEAAYEKHSCVNILDIGGTRRYWKIVPPQLLEEKNVTITVANLPGSLLPENEKHFKFIEADACSLANIQDHEFHIAHSNSVIEHVGDWSRMVQYSNEVKRVAESYFVQTPSYWFPIEPHFLFPFYHWLPKPMRIFLAMQFRLGHKEKAQSVDSAVKTVESARLLNRKMFVELFSDAEIMDEKIFFITKSFMALGDNTLSNGK